MPTLEQNNLFLKKFRGKSKISNIYNLFVENLECL